MNESQNTGAARENDNKKIESIENLLEACRDLQNEYSDDVQLYFRGESRASWELRPSVMRCSEEDKDKFPFRVWEGVMLNELMSRQPEAFSGLTSAFSQWVLAQHYGLKTRLLDITRNQCLRRWRYRRRSPACLLCVERHDQAVQQRHGKHHRQFRQTSSYRAESVVEPNGG
ncbi:MAG: FRG domain-containing protein [Candidatus Latescibacteria bacterium]|nr:FRG domain-containing protein [Candidatus Latescibacterota bacterium]